MRLSDVDLHGDLRTGSCPYLDPFIHALLELRLALEDLSAIPTQMRIRP
jgi:hypothetical protein